MSIKLIDKDENCTGIATNFFSICLVCLYFQQISIYRWQI